MLKTKIKNMEKTIGMYIQLGDLNISRIAALAGYDYVWVDTEHSYMTLDAIFAHVLALKTTNTPIIVRLPQDDLTMTKKVLEIGVDGIIFPMVKTAEEANRLIASTLYPPLGNRGYGPMHAVDYGLTDYKTNIKNNKEKLCRFIQIEHKSAIEELDEIMKNPYIDGYIFGPCDLSGSYDMLNEVYAPEIIEIMKNAIKKLHDNGKYVGIACGGYSDEMIKHYSSFGVEMITAGADFEFLRDSAIKNRENLEKLHKFR